MYLHFAVRTLQIQLNFVSKIVLTKCEKCFSDQEFFLKVQGWRPWIWNIFEITRTLYSTSEKSKQSLKQNSFFTCSWRCLRSNALKLEKMLAFRNLQEKHEKNFTMHCPAGNIFWGQLVFENNVHNLFLKNLQFYSTKNKTETKQNRRK